MGILERDPCASGLGGPPDGGPDCPAPGRLPVPHGEGNRRGDAGAHHAAHDSLWGDRVHVSPLVHGRAVDWASAGRAVVCRSPHGDEHRGAVRHLRP